MMNFLAVIPARFASTRLEGKPLIDICGKPMIQWVYEKATEVFDVVYVATDDERISACVESFGGKYVMTSADHENGTTRCLEAWEKIAAIENDTYHVIVNVQGDEPMVHTETLQHLRSCFADPKAEFATLILPVTNPDDLENESEVFVTIDKNKQALYFSRSVIPYVRGVQKRDWIHHATIYKHIGIYGFTPKALQAFCKLPPSKLETCERLEQNRWLEAGNKVKTAITFYDSVPVDTPADLERVRGMMAHALYGH